MGGSGVIDRFLGIFTQYIDSGFGLIQGDVRWLAGVLIAIDITLAGLFWLFSSGEEVLGRLMTHDIGDFAPHVELADSIATVLLMKDVALLQISGLRFRILKFGARRRQGNPKRDQRCHQSDLISLNHYRPPNFFK